MFVDLPAIVKFPTGQFAWDWLVEISVASPCVCVAKYPEKQPASSGYWVVQLELRLLATRSSCATRPVLTKLGSFLPHPP